MSDPVNIAQRYRDRLRNEVSRLEIVMNSPGPKYADRYTQGKLDQTKWLLTTIEHDLEHILGNKEKIKEANNG